jgi:hypothetical protein
MLTVVLGPTRLASLPEPPDRVAARLALWLRSPSCPVTGIRRSGWFQLALPPHQRRFLSPWMTLDVRAPGGPLPVALPTGLPASSDPPPPPPSCELFARFNPSPSIWTAFMLISLALITVASGAAMWALAQLIMHRPPHALWVIPACLAALVLLWAASAAGQRLARHDMHAMWAAVLAAARAGEQPAHPAA